MPDWTKPMQQTFEYYVVDPFSWTDTRKLDNVTSCVIERDSEADTLGSATIDITESLGECYIRVYLVAIQNGVVEKLPLGTFMIQTPSSTFDGKIREVSMDAYTPLIELKESPPPLGYSLLEGEEIMSKAYALVRENARAPVAAATSDAVLHNDFVANTDDTWITFLSDLIANANFIFDLDEMGRILFAPKQDTASLQPIWTYDDSNSSILYPEITMSHDLYGIPNVIQIVYSIGNKRIYAEARNEDETSPLSVQNRGREIVSRITNPGLNGNPTQTYLNEYAARTLKETSSLEYKLKYSHGYCPVRIGDCVRLNYIGAGITDVKAKVISQKISCKPGCKVDETAAFTKNLVNKIKVISGDGTAIEINTLTWEVT